MEEVTTLFDSDEAENEYMKEQEARRLKAEEEKQIEEMAQIMWDSLPAYDMTERDCRDAAEALCAAGYSKQIKSEWVMIPVDGVARYRCGNINCCRLIPFGAQPSEMAYCPRCGAKMDGKEPSDG